MHHGPRTSAHKSQRTLSVRGTSKEPAFRTETLGLSPFENRVDQKVSVQAAPPGGRGTPPALEWLRLPELGAGDPSRMGEGSAAGLQQRGEMLLHSSDSLSADDAHANTPGSVSSINPPQFKPFNCDLIPTLFHSGKCIFLLLFEHVPLPKHTCFCSSPSPAVTQCVTSRFLVQILLLIRSRSLCLSEKQV